jgi:hypothetical protein
MRHLQDNEIELLKKINSTDISDEKREELRLELLKLQQTQNEDFPFC